MPRQAAAANHWSVGRAYGHMTVIATAQFSTTINIMSFVSSQSPDQQYLIMLETLVEEKPLCFAAVLYFSSSFIQKVISEVYGFQSYFHIISSLGVV